MISSASLSPSTDKFHLHVQNQFHDRIAQLVYTFPEDATTSTGSLFWSAPKRFPHALNFNPADPAHAAFVQAAAILKAESSSIDRPKWAYDESQVWGTSHFWLCSLVACTTFLPHDRSPCKPHMLQWPIEWQVSTYGMRLCEACPQHDVLQQRDVVWLLWFNPLPLPLTTCKSVCM